jgi:hypothetical protein
VQGKPRFSQGAQEILLAFLYFSYNFDKISYRDAHKHLLSFVKNGTAKKHALIGDFFSVLPCCTMRVKFGTRDMHIT